ncbi:MAG TPA: hypothetical protein VFQ70_01775 [Candidatus Saccharimonadaceae bacterium]|nr:hypothetical protein [Candidatus Saccharimonadaceae bacterium]
MPATSLLSRLQHDHPSLHFMHGDGFRWSPTENTVFYDDANDFSQLLHETSHALLHHHTFTRDITLLEMERDAWQKARELARKYHLKLTDDTVDSALDTYRDWLEARSTCPVCSMTGVQHTRFEYRCPACLAVWRVNDARVCGLKRYIIKK